RPCCARRVRKFAWTPCASWSKIGSTCARWRRRKTRRLPPPPSRRRNWSPITSRVSIMLNSPTFWSNSWNEAACLVMTPLVCQLLSQSRRHPDEFAEFCFTDAEGAPLRQGQVHRDLQAFLGRQRRGLVELPRD